jgi:L-arabinose isomerase
VNILDSAVAKVFNEVGTEEVKALEEKMGAKYKLDDDFVGEEFSRSMRLAVAMKRLTTDLELDALTVYCQSMWQHPEVGVVPCIAISLLAQEGVFTSCEGDVLTALSGMILGSFTAGKSVFTEIWTNDFGNDCFMMGHSGLMNLALFEKDPTSVKLSRHPWWTGCHGRGACLQLQMPAGQVTLLGICPVRGGNWRMIVTTGDVTDRPYVPLGAPNFFLKVHKPIKQFLDDFVVLGAAHHLSMAYGDWTEQLKALAKLLRIEYCHV